MLNIFFIFQIWQHWRKWWRCRLSDVGIHLIICSDIESIEKRLLDEFFNDCHLKWAKNVKFIGDIRSFWSYVRVCRCGAHFNFYIGRVGENLISIISFLGLFCPNSLGKQALGWEFSLDSPPLAPRLDIFLLWTFVLALPGPPN